MELIERAVLEHQYDYVVDALQLTHAVTIAGAERHRTSGSPRLISPKVFETRWRQLRISHRVLNIFVA